MKIIFAGTPVFAATALRALIAAKHEIVLVLTQPDRPAGRGMKTVASAVKLLAQEYELALLQPQTLKSSELLVSLQSFDADIMVVAAYGLILPETVLNIPRFGCLNIHASLLPRWRGAAPIQRAILAGDKETGITIMQMDLGLDTGVMLLKQSIAITQNDTTQSLHDKLCELGARSIVTGLTLLQQKKLIPSVQDEAFARYAPKIKKTEAEIDWQLPAEQIDRIVRTFNPMPGSYTYFRGNLLKIWKVKVVIGDSNQPGVIVAVGHRGITVACGHDMLILETIQKSGGKKLSAVEFLAGYDMQAGEYLGSESFLGEKND